MQSELADSDLFIRKLVENFLCYVKFSCERNPDRLHSFPSVAEVILKFRIAVYLCSLDPAEV